MTSKRPYRPTALQVLTRNFNWRMGSLRRLMMGAYQLDSDLNNQVQELVRQQMDRDRFKYEAGVMALKTGNPGGYMDQRLHDAIYESERAQLDAR